MASRATPLPGSAGGALPVVALIGRPNVGKSTLFNQLTRTRDALVADFPGLTRDRQYGVAGLPGFDDDDAGQRRFVVVDTGGIGVDQNPDFREMTETQARMALEEADVAVFLVDAKTGTAADDADIAERLRKSGKPVVVAANKSERLEPEIAAADFHGFGLGEPVAIAAVHRRGLRELGNRIVALLPPPEPELDETEQRDRPPRVAVIGRPNVGKSTLVNRLLGEERLVAVDAPGATRDSIEVEFEWREQPYTLIDTAGLRKKAKVDEIAEKFSAIKTLQAIEAADVVIAVVDARDSIGVQDARVLGYAADAGRSLIIAVNKWDGMERHERTRVKNEIAVKLPYLDFAPLHTISALNGSGLGELMESVTRATKAAKAKMSTNALTKALEQATHTHQPPLARGRRIKLRYAHQGGMAPPRIVIHGNQVDRLGADYKRYLSNYFRKTFDLFATPVVMEFRSGDNPFEGRREKLTPRQRRTQKLRGPGKRVGGKSTQKK